MKSARLRTWILPATGLSLAVAAVGYLLVLEVADEGEATAGQVAGAGVTVVQPSIPPRSAEPYLPPTPPPPRVVTPEEARPKKKKTRRAKESTRRVERETPQVLLASRVMASLATQSDLRQRLKTLDDELAKLPQDRALLVLRGLLDAVLPGTHREAGELRLAVLAKVASYPGPVSSAVLVQRLDSEKPRPQRLLALEMLALRTYAGRAEMEAIVRQDHDTVVQDKARWVLRRSQ